jgi:hypothetical protein
MMTRRFCIFGFLFVTRMRWREKRQARQDGSHEIVSDRRERDAKKKEKRVEESETCAMLRHFDEIINKVACNSPCSDSQSLRIKQPSILKSCHTNDK